MSGLYQISNLGRIRRIDKSVEKILKPGTQKSGYLYVNLCKNGKTSTCRVHRLVAEAFIPNPDNLPQVNHKNEIKADNNYLNLEWCNEKYNMNYGTRNLQASKSRGIPIRCIETNALYHSAREASRKTGIHQSSISRCCNGDYGFKTAGGYHWEYINVKRKNYNKIQK